MFLGESNEVLCGTWVEKPNYVEGDGKMSIEIEISRIDPSPFQPRINLKLEEIEERIKQDGIIQRLIVRPIGELWLCVLFFFNASFVREFQLVSVCSKVDFPDFQIAVIVLVK